MTISRENIPQQMFYEEGGAANSTDIGLQELASLIKQKQDFGANKAKYEERLGGMIEPQQPMDIYEAASQLGKGLLQTPNTGGASAYTGLAAGFNNIVDESRRREETARQERQQVAMKAMELAMTDEREAEKYLYEMSSKLIEKANADVDYITVEYTDVNGKTQVTREPDTPAGNEIINDLIKTKNGTIIEPEKRSKEIEDNISLTDEAAAKAYEKSAIFQQEAANSAKPIRDKVSYARDLVNRVGAEAFGPTQSAFLKAKELAVDLGLEKYFDVDPSVVGVQKAIRQLSMDFTMGIVSQTKGAISNKEMQLFQNASPGLGSTYEGFQEQLKLLDRYAKRKMDFYAAWTKESSRLEKTEGVDPSELNSRLAAWENQWYDDNPFFSQDETDRLNAAVEENKRTQEAIDFNADEFKEKFSIKKYQKENPQIKKDDLTLAGINNEKIAEYNKFVKKYPDATPKDLERAQTIIFGKIVPELN